MVLVAALLLFAYGFFQQQPAWNEYSRYDLVRALVEGGTTRIDAYQENTGDKAFYQGHWYSDKAPGSALLGVPVYGALALGGQLTGSGPPAQDEAIQALAFAISGIPTVLLVLLLIAFLRPLVGERWSIAVGLAYGLGSMAFPFATLFFGHASSTAALFAAFFLLHRHRTRPGRWTPVVAGFLAGWAVLTEIPVALGVVALAIYALLQGRGVAARFVAGGLPLAAVLMAYNWLSFGNPLSVGYQYAALFSEQNQQGLVSIVWPTLDRTRELLFDLRGLLRLAPWLAVAPLGLVALRRRELRSELVLAATMCAAFVTYNSGALNPFGGWTSGPRYLMPALPFAAILVAVVPVRLRFFTAPLMLVGAAAFLVATVTMPNAPERFEDPLAQLWLPRLASGQLAETAAWLRWGLGGFNGLAVLVVGLGMGVTTLAVSFGDSARWARIAGRGAAVLAVLALAFSVPFPPPAPVVVGWPGLGAAPAISVFAVGHTPIRLGATEEIQLWVRFENRGGVVPAGRLQFAVFDADGRGVWSAWYGHAIVSAASRRTVRMTWSPPADLPAGSYRYGFSITDEASGATLGQGMAGGSITLER